MCCAYVPVRGWSRPSSDTIFDMANTKTIGDVSEAIVLAEFLKAGFPVLLPFGENQRYHLVVEIGGRFLRVQVKTCQSDGSALVFNATSHDGHRPRQSYRGDADLFAVYSPLTKQVYVLAVDEVPETRVWLRLTPAKNNQVLGIRQAELHTLEAWVERQSSGVVTAGS